MLFGEIIKKTREAMNLSQDDASKMIEKKYAIRLSAPYLSMIENGMRTNITVNVIKALLDFYSLPFSAAASLFQNIIAEKKVPYTVSSPETETQIANLPEEAKRSIDEFTAYIITKYGKDVKK